MPPIAGKIPPIHGLDWKDIYDEAVYGKNPCLRMPLSSKTVRCNCPRRCAHPYKKLHMEDQEYHSVVGVFGASFAYLEAEHKALDPILPNTGKAIVYNPDVAPTFIQLLSIRKPDLLVFEPQVPYYYELGYESKISGGRRVNAESKMNEEELAEHRKLKEIVGSWARSVFCPGGSVGAVTFYKSKRDGISGAHFHVVLNSRFCANKGGNHNSAASYCVVRVPRSISNLYLPLSTSVFRDPFHTSTNIFPEKPTNQKKNPTFISTAVFVFLHPKHCWVFFRHFLNLKILRVVGDLRFRFSVLVAIGVTAQTHRMHTPSFVARLSTTSHQNREKRLGRSKWVHTNVVHMNESLQTKKKL